MMLNAPFHRRLLFTGLALTLLMPAAARAQGLVEYAIILALADGVSVGSSYDLCAYNPGNTRESATFEFDPSDPMAASERFEVVVDPGQTKCRDYVPVQGGALLRIRQIPGESAGTVPWHNDVWWQRLDRVAIQVFLKDLTGARTGVISAPRSILIRKIE